MLQRDTEAFNTYILRTWLRVTDTVSAVVHRANSTLRDLRTVAASGPQAKAHQ